MSLAYRPSKIARQCVVLEVRGQRWVHSSSESRSKNAEQCKYSDELAERVHGGCGKATVAPRLRGSRITELHAVAILD